MIGLEGKRILVTGGAQGIGWAIARRFAADGARVAVNDLREGPALAETAEVLGRFGGLDVLVNNAGIQVQAASDAMTLDHPTRWPACSPSSRPMTPPTSPARPSSSTAA